MILQKIGRKYLAAKISCCNEKCSIRIGNTHNFVMLKGELLVKTNPEKMCDCIVFQELHDRILFESLFHFYLLSFFLELISSNPL